MAENSKIEWTDHSWSPWRGCTKVSPGCENCYAEALALRFGLPPYRRGEKRTKTVPSGWSKPVRWNAHGWICTECGTDHRQRNNSCESAIGRRPRVFFSLADPFDDEVPIEWLADLLKLIHDTPNLDWLLLTKRPENWRPRMAMAMEYLFDKSASETWNFCYRWSHKTAPSEPKNIWIGATVEDEPRMQRHIHLMQIPARVHFWSVEPMLSELNCEKAWSSQGAPDWVINGGESGPNKRPIQLDWMRSIRDQCRAAGVKYFCKQIDKVQPIPADLMIREFPV